MRMTPEDFYRERYRASWPPARYQALSRYAAGPSASAMPSVDELMRESPMERSLGDRELTTRIRFLDLVYQLRERQELYQQHVYEIACAETATVNAMLQSPLNVEGLAPAEVYLGVRKTLDRLEADRRRERLDFWRDQSRLRLDLPESLAERLDASRRRRLLDGLLDDL